MGIIFRKRIFVMFAVLALNVILLNFALASPVGTLNDPGGTESSTRGIRKNDLYKLVAANNTFAFQLYQAVSNKRGNLFYSPYSISLALAMTYAGARNETAQQMAGTLRFTLSQKRLHPAFYALGQELASRGEGSGGKDGEGFRLNVANSIWGESSYLFLPEFLNVLSENYGAGLRILDFINFPEDARTDINNWISDETEEKIENLIPPGVISSDTRLVLANACYFNAAWKFPFNEEQTLEDAFNLLDGSQVAVPMMSQAAIFHYARGEGYQAVELLYDGEELSMVIMLPQKGRFGEFESSLTMSQIDAILGDLEPVYLDLEMPKFSLEPESISLKQTLSDMGMPLAFGAADFSGMDGTHDLYIEDVMHKAFILVDEAGTEAAAATAVVVSITCLPSQITINRPFIFLIRDIKTGAILFLGRVVNPAQ